MKHFFTNPQLEKLSDVLVVMGEVIFASAVIPFFLNVDKLDNTMVYSGLVATAGCWMLAIILVRKVRK